MVYFTCGTCGEQVKKPQVEKHYTQKCRNCTMLTCIDCLKDFYGDEYKKHNQCMTEAQRYSKEGREGWDPTVGQGNKGEMKQQAWIGRLRGLLETEENVDPVVKNIIDTILDHDNIPRKRPKFVNFVKNIMRNKVRDYNIEATWELFSKALQPPKTEEAPAAPEPPAEAETETENKKEKKDKKKKKKGKEEEPAPEPEVEQEEPKKKKKKEKKKGKNKENIEEETTEMATETNDVMESGKGKKGKKRKLDETMEVDQDETLEPAEKKGKFDWDEIITSILTKKDEMKLNKLKKKCISEFMVVFPDTHKSQEELGAKFDKKLKKRKYKVLKDKVRLAHPEEEVSPETQENGTNGVKTNGVNGDHTNGDNQTGDEKISWNKWEATNLGNNAQTEKFRRLMGIKTSKPPQAVAAEPRNDGKIFKDLEDGFERARNIHFKAKGKGLGFS